MGLRGDKNNALRVDGQRSSGGGIGPWDRFEDSATFSLLGTSVPVVFFLYLGARALLPHWAPAGSVESLRSVLDWVSWLVLGAMVEAVSVAARGGYSQSPGPARSPVHLPSLALLGGITTLLLAVAVFGRMRVSVEMDFGYVLADLRTPAANGLILVAFWLGIFHRLFPAAATKGVRRLMGWGRSWSASVVEWWKQIRRTGQRSS